MRVAYPWGLFAFLLPIVPLQAGELKSFQGYTRPGIHEAMLPPTRLAAGDEDRGQPFGASVYFMVFELSQPGEADPWGTGIPNFAKSFKPGLHVGQGPSPELNAQANYLYLYQVVNDRPSKTPVESVSIKLLVEPKDISSWGSFKDLGFASPAADVEEAAGKIRPVSAVHGLDFHDTRRQYTSPARPVSNQPLRLIQMRSTKDENLSKAEKDRLINVTWDPVDQANTPDYVMLLNDSDFNKYPSFRAIWSGANVIGPGAKSSVFGFTSNQPPKFEPVRIRTTQEEGKKLGRTGILFVGSVPAADDGDEEVGLKEGPVGAEGNVPTPVPEVPIARTPTETGAGGGGNLPPTLPAPGGGTGSGTGGGFGMTTPRVNMGQGQGSGQGSGGGLGGGNGGGAAQSEQKQTGQGTINFNATLLNQQLQLQAQSQTQGQGQSQKGGGGHGNVIPEPASFLAAFLGAPALMWMMRQRRRSI